MSDDVPQRRLKTGVSGLDELFEGGLPEGNIVLLSGAAGTGKSTVALGFIYNGAKLYGEPGVYLTLEEFPDRFISNAKMVGFSDIDGLISEKRMSVVRAEIFEVDKLVGTIEDLVEQYSAKRLVIDSVSVLSAFAEKPFLVRRAIFEMANMLKRQKVTTMFTAGTSATTEGHFGVSVEEYAVDGIITLFHQLVGTQFVRAVGVVKMRGTSHSESLHPISITRSGVIVHTDLTIPEGFRV